MRFSGLILIVLLAAAACFVAAPWFAFRSLRDAAKANDVPALSRLVDYDAVSDSLEPQVAGAPAPQSPPPDIWRHPVEAIERALQPHRPPPPQLERYMTSQGLAALTEGKPPGARLSPGGREPFPMIAFWGPDRCRIVVADPDAPSRKTEFTFQRRGLFSWKLTRIVRPGRAAPAAAAE